MRGVMRSIELCILGTGCFGYVALDWSEGTARIIVALAGSQDAAQWLSDVDCLAVDAPRPASGKGHSPAHKSDR